jgi:PAS domain S-box-containing protein
MIEDTVSKMKSLDKLFTTQLESDADMMGAVLEVILRDEELKTALKAKDREALLEMSLPLFDRLRSDYRVTHFYFTGPDHVNILRVHKPDKHGDKIDRFTTLEAEKTGKHYYGIELGPLGTFTLRTVEPWYDGEQLIGYVELGEEIEHITQKLHNALDVEIYVLIEKQFLDRRNWEAGMRMLGHNAQWDRFPSVALIDQTSNLFPQDLARIFSEEGRPHAVTNVDVSFNDRNYQCRFLNLKDAGSRIVGEIVVMRDVTDLLEKANATIIRLIVFCLLVGGVLFLLFNKFLGRMQKELETANREIIRISQAVESASDAILLTDTKGNAIYSNKAFFQLFECKAKDLNSSGGLPILYSYKKIAQEVFETIKRGSPWGSEVEMRSRSGLQFPVYLRADIIKGKIGEDIGLIYSHTNITERKKGEEALRQSAALETLTTVLENFIGDSLANLLTPIYGHIELCEIRDNIDQIKIELGDIKEGITALLTCIKAYGNFTKGGERSFGRISSVDIKSILGPLLSGEPLKTYGEEEFPIDPNIKLRFVYDPKQDGALNWKELPSVSGSKTAIATVLQETLINGVESYDPKKGGSVIASAKKKDHNLILEIADKGRGMSSDERDKSQLPFFKILGMKGSARFGLGAYIARESAKYCGGDIQIESREGVGTTASILLKVSD